LTRLARTDRTVCRLRPAQTQTDTLGTLLSPIFDMSDSRSRAAGLIAAVRALSAGELVGMPTETVYGLAADAANGRAIACIYTAKGRPRFNPLIVHVGSLRDAEEIAAFSPDARRLAEAFWPGPFTLVLPKSRSSGIADLVTAGLDTVALRVPAHPVARDLIAAFGGPIAAPSANRSGHVSPTTAAHVAADLCDAVACILDAGPCEVGLESTIIGLAGGEADLLRPGAVARDAVERVLGRELAVPGDGTIAAPGMLASHYAPNAALRLDAAEVRPGEALIAFGALPPARAELAVATVNLSRSGDLAEAAANLFSALRELDEKAPTIAVMPIPDAGVGEAINDRLRRAAAPRERAES
jgi:L-threonylcarbamoyladenylate synthase